MSKNIYNKSKFGFLSEDNKSSELIECDRYYYRHEIRFCRKFPFLKKEFIEYKFVDEHWIEQ